MASSLNKGYVLYDSNTCFNLEIDTTIMIAALFILQSGNGLEMILLSRISQDWNELKLIIKTQHCFYL